MQNSSQIEHKKVGRVSTSALWTLMSNATDRFISFFSIAILARLLTPKDFGIVAIAGSIVAFAELLNAFGFDWALVRHSNPTRDHYNTAWTLRILSGVLSVLVLGIIIFIMVVFFDQSPLMPLMVVMAFSILVGSFDNIGTVDFRRNYAFNLEFILRLTAKISGFIVATVIAFIYHSYWALVFGTLVSRLVGSIMSYILHEFRPQFSLAKTRELFSFSIWMLATNTLVFLRTCFANLFIGYHFGSKATGMYSMANEIAHLGSTELAAPILRVAYSRYAQHAHQFEKLQEDFLITASIIWMLALPTTAGIFAVSNEVVALMLGQQWVESVEVLQLLVIGGACNVIISNTHYIYLAQGFVKTSFYLNAFTIVTTIVLSLVLVTSYGLNGVAIGYAIAALLSVPLNYYVLWRVSGIGFAKLWKQVWRTCVAALGMLLLLHLFFGSLPVHSSIEALLPLALKITSGVVLYISLLLGLWRICGMPEGPESFALNMFKNYLPWQKKARLEV